MTLYRLQHEPGVKACATGWHCHSHHVDESDRRGRQYITCPECFHLYASAWALKRAYIRESFRLWRMEMRSPLRPPEMPGADELFGPVTTRLPRLVATGLLIYSLFNRPSRISFCQECGHDF